ncbi:MAG: hypothetical protein A2498_16420 [Lentisphaerae bacterium RIFOXYC12_FULL_60_16]|nr:MAG: hypothetical protein A2498_16420 [Lentisphaerae bacterium RIFOXYC12_FULL_60_16]
MGILTTNTVGRVTTQIVRISLPPEGFRLECGQCLPELQIAYETYGTLSDLRDNAVFICHALSGDAHVAGWHDAVGTGMPGWWEEMVGPGKGIDTLHYFVVCANILGGCKGTTGPGSIHPATGKPYGSSFPPITVGDIVQAHSLLVKHLGITGLAGVVGGSFGGMQALEWAIREPEVVSHCVCIASASRLSTQALAFDIVGRQAIMADAGWQNGDYYGNGHGPEAGLSLARKIGHITYLSPEMMGRKFGRDRHEVPDGGQSGTPSPFHSNFEVERYLNYQGRKFVGRFDANSYLHITRAMDQYDLGERAASLESALVPVRGKVMIVALSSDWLFPPEQSIELASALLRGNKRVSYCNLHAPHGHDAFLVDVEHLAAAIRAFLPWVEQPDELARREDPAGMRDAGRKTEFDSMERWIPSGSKVLDLGCGSGALLSRLRASRRVHGVGVEIDIQQVIGVLDEGHDVFQADVDGGLAMIPDGSYEVAILSETLQEMRNPRLVLREMMRVAHQGIVSFPNFGKWSRRLQLWFTGRMPKGGALPFEWYDTPNIHLFTFLDFLDLCRVENIDVLDVVCMPASWVDRALIGMGLRNAGAERVIARISRTSDGAPAPSGDRAGGVV